MSCPICGHFDAHIKFSVLEQEAANAVECSICGRFIISKAVLEIKKDELRDYGYVLSGLARQAKEQGSVPPQFTMSNIESYFGEERWSLGVLERLNLLLLYLAKNSRRAGAEVTIVPANDYPVAFAKDVEEFEYMLEALSGLDLLERQTYIGMDPSDEQSVTITIAGWAKVDECRESSPSGKQCFVAMWFDSQVEEAFSLGIQPALYETGFQAFRVDKTEHNDKIDDLIVVQIRKSSLLIADVTGHRQGVYFEAGLAMGLGIPVVWTCREDNMKDCHFDTRQYNHIVWDNPDSLRERLRNRILATMPRK